MKNFFLFFCLVISFKAFSESTQVHPFELEFSVPTNRLEVKAELLLSCRYEKLVLGDSSEYYVKNETVSLPVVKIKDQLRISHKNISSLEIRGNFRSNPGCMSELRLSFIDSLYAIGWAGQTSRPISFMLKEGYFYRAGDSVLDISNLERQISNRFVEFLYVSTGSQVNVWMTADGKKLPLSPISSAQDPATGMPYRLSTRTNHKSAQE